MTGTLYLFDTSVLLHLVRGKDLGRYINHTFHLEDLIERPLVSAVTHGEIWVLADRNNWGTEKRAALERMLNNLVPVDLYDHSIIGAYVEMDRASRAVPKGARNLSDNDLWIAATARAAEAVLLTTDNDFLHFHPGHCLVQYIDPASRLPGEDAGWNPGAP